MQLKQLFDDQDAVSPVIGVILMVAITVILAAVIGTFVLGLGDQVQSSAPNANFQFSYGDDGGSPATTYFNVTHNGGQDIDPATVEVQAGGGDAVAWTSASSGDTSIDSISTGNSVGYTYADGGSGVKFDATSGDTIRIIWSSSGGGSSNTIGSSTIPN